MASTENKSKKSSLVGDRMGGGMFGINPPLQWPCLREASLCSAASSDDLTLTSPSMENSSAELLPGGDSPVNKRMTENLLTSLSEHEREAILSVPAAHNPEDLRMFAR